MLWHFGDFICKSEGEIIIKKKIFESLSEFSSNDTKEVR